MKNNISFYRHEANSHNHWKFKTLRRKYKWEGEGKFWALNNIIADAECCLLDLSNEGKRMVIAADLDFDIEEFNEFVDYLVNVCHLLKDKDGYYTTDIVQEIYEEVNSKRERQRNWKKEKSTAKNEKSTETFGKSTVDSEQSKVKESKEDSISSKVDSNSKTGIVVGGETPPTPTKPTLEEKQEKCKVRMREFGLSLQPYEAQYPKDMLKAFYNYWKEMNKSRTKMKFELEQTWDLKLRLIRWEKNNYQFKKGKHEPSTDDLQKHKSEFEKATQRSKQLAADE